MQVNNTENFLPPGKSKDCKTGVNKLADHEIMEVMKASIIAEIRHVDMKLVEYLKENYQTLEKR